MSVPAPDFSFLQGLSQQGASPNFPFGPSPSKRCGKRKHSCAKFLRFARVHLERPQETALTLASLYRLRAVVQPRLLTQPGAHVPAGGAVFKSVRQFSPHFQRERRFPRNAAIPACGLKLCNWPAWNSERNGVRDRAPENYPPR